MQVKPVLRLTISFYQKAKQLNLLNTLKLRTTMYPHLANNQDYTAIINDKQYLRLHRYLEDAQRSGAKIIEINPKHELLSTQRKIAPTLVTGVTTEMQLMQHEIFGPILPIMVMKILNKSSSLLIADHVQFALYYLTLIKLVPIMSLNEPTQDILVKIWFSAMLHKTICLLAVLVHQAWGNTMQL